MIGKQDSALRKKSLEVLEQALIANPHLKQYIDHFKATTGKAPDFHEMLSREMGELEYPNILYPVDEQIFIHIYGDEEGKKYYAIEPQLSEVEEQKYRSLLAAILEKAPLEQVPRSDEELKRTIIKIMDNCIKIGSDSNGRLAKILGLGKVKIPVTELERKKFLYFLERDIIGNSVLEPLMRDPYIEDVNNIGTQNIYIIHKIFGFMETNLSFKDEFLLHNFLRNISERIGRPVSEVHCIVDGTLPDGSRINIVFTDDVSRRGSSFTIRKFQDIPISITQLIDWGTINSEIAAYLWLCLENGMSVFICGETASGKTTALNAAIAFINPLSKVLSAEDTAEVKTAHRVWQQLLTREFGPEEAQVDLFMLLKTALRSRPNYIIVGEIRGKEGSVAFQAMQTGQPVMATFHASSAKRMIQRFIGDPINVPVTFIDNLNVCMILQAVYIKGKFLRRCIAVEEIEGYFPEAGGVVTRTVFEWDSTVDKHIFRGMNNSYILENKIAKKMGYLDKREVYEELLLRAKILDKMVARKIFNYNEVVQVINAYYRRGLDGLPFKL